MKPAETTIVPLLEVFVPVSDEFNVGDLDVMVTESLQNYLDQDPENRQKLKEHLQNIIDSL